VELPVALGQYLAHAHVTQIILGMALVMARVLPLTLIAPFLGGDLVEAEVKIGIGITLSMILYPIAAAGHPIPVFALPFVGLLIKEVALGGAIAFTVSLIFDAARAAGTFVDTMSGANMATAMVPQIQQQASLFADLQFQMTVVLFLTLNGHHIVIESLAESFNQIPIDRYPTLQAGSWAFFEMIIREGAHLLVVGLALAAPAGASVFLVDVALGLVNRVAPQVQVYFMSMSMKPLVVVFVMLSAIDLFSAEVVHQFGHSLAAMRHVVELLR
jgi:flagellar biosynthetic protein FliR